MHSVEMSGAQETVSDVYEANYDVRYTALLTMPENRACPCLYSTLMASKMRNALFSSFLSYRSTGQCIMSTKKIMMSRTLYYE